MEDNCNKIKNEEIKNVSDYLRILRTKVEELTYRTGYSFICYRGEDRDKVTKNGTLFSKGVPNIFRRDTIGAFNAYKWFEKNILDEMKSNRMSEGDQYIEIAMDAQHGGFPSRLLDVSFNSLIALYFAVTPFYTYGINDHDEIDGRVLIYAFDKITTSSTETIIEIYNKIINKEKYVTFLDSHFHMLIDFVDLNSRIRAQQGAFILFGGNQYVPIPEWNYVEIKIPADSKPTLRKELELFFGINTGMIYPEPNNRVPHITQRAKIIENDIDFYEIVKKEIIFDLNSMKTQVVKLSTSSNSKVNQKFPKAIKELNYYLQGLNLIFQTEFANSNSQSILEIKKILQLYVLEINTLYSKQINGNIINPNLFI